MHHELHGSCSAQFRSEGPGSEAPWESRRTWGAPNVKRSQSLPPPPPPLRLLTKKSFSRIQCPCCSLAGWTWCGGESHISDHQVDFMFNFQPTRRSRKPQVSANRHEMQDELNLESSLKAAGKQMGIARLCLWNWQELVNWKELACTYRNEIFDSRVHWPNRVGLGSGSVETL